MEPGVTPQVCLPHAKKRGARGKYGVKRVKGPTRSHASQWEADRSAELELLQRAGAIADLRHQVWFHHDVKDVTTGHPCRLESYVSDFVYLRDGEQVVEDAKAGLITADFRRKARWMRAVLGIVIYEHHKPAKRR